MTAIDAAGNESEPLELTLPFQPATLPKPTGLKAGTVTSTTAALTWDGPLVRPGSPLPTYNVYVNGALAKSTITGNSATITGLQTATKYTFTVAAVSGDGLIGAPSDALEVTTLPSDPRPEIRRQYALAGSTQLKTLTKGALPLAGDVDAEFNVVNGAFVADLALRPTQGRLVALGFIPVTAKVAFVTSGKTTGALLGNTLGTQSQVRIKLPEVKLFGAVPLAGGNNCQTKSLSKITLRSTGTFDPYAGGTLAGTFAISDLNGCGVLNGLVSPLTAGGGNTISLTLTAKSGQ